MTTRMIDNRVAKLTALERQIEELEQQAEAIRNEIKAEMEAQQTEEISTSRYTIRWKSIISNRFDTKAFKAEFAELYTRFCKASASRRFTITAA